jgi:hypothetical protein
MPADPKPTRKPRIQTKPYQRKPKAAVPKDGVWHRTAAKPIPTKKHETLTLHDWMTVFTYMDDHPSMTQGDVVRHFATKVDGALTFDQSTLSRKVKARPELEKRITSYPNALSSKRLRTVTRPDVERALVLWAQHMEEKGETFNGPMLKEKRARFEQEFDVPESEQLKGDGWIGPFCRAHGYKERRQHGEAGSVDLEAVKAERKRVGMILNTYAPKDRWNLDESALFAL